MVCAFGRLGTMFGCDYYHIKPDLVSIAKVSFHFRSASVDNYDWVSLLDDTVNLAG